MRTITADQALTEALAEEMRRDPRVITFGEGVATKNYKLAEEFGAKRVRNTPLSEGIIAGTAAGAAASGLRPVIDLLFAPFVTFAMDELVNSAGKLRFMSGGQFSFPLVTIVRTGAGWGVGAQHNHNNEAWFVHTPGVKVVMPSTPADFKALLKSAIRDDNPVMFFVDLGLLFAPGEVGDEEVVEIGKAAVRHEGTDVTLISYAKTVHKCMEAVGALEEVGVSAEVIDLRSLKPLDEATILASAKKTGRVVVVTEASGLAGVAAEIGALVAEKAFSSLKAPVQRVTGPDAPAAASYPLEQAYVPSKERIIEAALRTIAPQ
ncbi:MAG TPA: transketolase C-terminal domain-containing protein [Thermoanaerobaculia bacterium]|nr:transketolase C-terminal domain-containing protein [Thermoanaerobaculia bacterium]